MQEHPLGAGRKYSNLYFQFFIPLNFLQITDMHKKDFFKIIGYDSYTNAGIKTHSGKETRPWNWRNSTYIVMKSKESHLRKSEGSHQETQCEIRKPDPSFPVSCHSQQGHEIRVSRRNSAWGWRLIVTYLSGPAAQRSSGHFIYIVTSAVNFIYLRYLSSNPDPQGSANFKRGDILFSTEFYFRQIPWLITTSITKAWLNLLKTHR